jgi:hypothetical protein
VGPAARPAASGAVLGLEAVAGAPASPVDRAVLPRPAAPLPVAAAPPAGAARQDAAALPVAAGRGARPGAVAAPRS